VREMNVYDFPRSIYGLSGAFSAAISLLNPDEGRLADGANVSYQVYRIKTDVRERRQSGEPCLGGSTKQASARNPFGFSDRSILV